MGRIDTSSQRAPSSQPGVVPGYDLAKDGPDELAPDDLARLKMRMPDPPARKDYKGKSERKRRGRAWNGEL